jgi:carbon monoxide dehydrogenase subunit G
MDMKISGGGFGSAVDLTAGADVSDAGGGQTKLSWSGQAVARGPVAAVGGRVLDAQAQKLISHTFANVRERLSAGK